MRHVFPIVGWQQRIIPNHWNTAERGGSDLFAPFGTPVVAMCDGTVIYAGNDPIGGINVSIRDAEGLTYYYAHLDDRFVSAPLVSTGQTVHRGQQLGAVGDSGNARGKGAHLHIGIGYGISTGSGPGGGCGLNFDAVALLQQVLDGGSPPPEGFRVANTDGAGLNLRAAPSTSAAAIKLMPEGAPVAIRDRAWRPVRDPADGATGWAAEQFLMRDGQRYRVVNTDGAGLNLRSNPDTSAAAVKLLPDGTILEVRDRAWRPVRDPADDATGWAAEQFLSNS